MTTATMTLGTRTMEPTTRPRRSLEELVDRLMDALTFVEESPLSSTPVEKTIDESPAMHRRSLEELVDRLMSTLTFRIEPPPNGVPRAIHEARRLRKSGDLDGALKLVAAADVGNAEPREARWAFTEWKHLVKRRYCDDDILLYSQGTGRATALVPRDKSAAVVVAVLGMKWTPGKRVSRRSLRGLRPLARGGASC